MKIIKAGANLKNNSRQQALDKLTMKIVKAGANLKNNRRQLQHQPSTSNNTENWHHTLLEVGANFNNSRQPQNRVSTSNIENCRRRTPYERPQSGPNVKISKKKKSAAGGLNLQKIRYNFHHDDDSDDSVIYLD